MAFPGTYNFSYYRGDTFEFRIYPKNPSGQPFTLTDYSVAFTIASSRGDNLPESPVSGYAVIAPDNTYITCAILPDDGLQLNANQNYVYDIEIRDTDALPYPKVYTLLTGSISVTEQITNIEEDPGVS